MRMNGLTVPGCIEWKTFNAKSWSSSKKAVPFFSSTELGTFKAYPRSPVHEDEGEACEEEKLVVPNSGRQILLGKHFVVVKGRGHGERHEPERRELTIRHLGNKTYFAAAFLEACLAEVFAIMFSGRYGIFFFVNNDYYQSIYLFSKLFYEPSIASFL